MLPPSASSLPPSFPLISTKCEFLPPQPESQGVPEPCPWWSFFPSGMVCSSNISSQLLCRMLLEVVRSLMRLSVSSWRYA